jgi:hypothetical protein
MPLSSLTVTLTDTRLIDGWVEAANRNNTTPSVIAQEFLTTQGRSYADLFRVGIITGAAFVSRFTPSEYGDILAAATPPPDATEEQIAAAAQVQALLDQLFESPNVALDDPRLAPGLALLVSMNLLDATRPAEILSYVRPEPTGGA